MIGRPFFDIASIEDELFDNIVAFGSIYQACRQPGMPAMSTVHAHARRDPEFGKRLLAARAMGCNVLAEEILEIADADPERNPDGSIDTGHVAWSKHRVDVRKWTAERVASALYSATQKLQHTGADNQPLAIYSGLPPRPEDLA